MHILKLSIDNLSLAKMLASMLSRLDFVKSVDIESKSKSKREFLSSKDWIAPGRPATDEEIEQLCLEMENDMTEYSAAEVMHFVSEEINEWKNKKK
jgi:hypothetical protein